MARRDLRHSEGVPGDWYIDDRCIGCGASTSIAPELIGPAPDGRHFVFHRQPRDSRELRLAQLAAEVCPSRSIGTESIMRWAPHHPMEVSDGVWRCGHNALDTVGGNSFLVIRETGNLLVDSPRYSARLRGQLEDLGGVRQVLLTHRDDVGAAELYASEFGAEVLIHEGDRDAAPFATRVLTGRVPVEIVPGVVAVPTPGHTAGHLMFLLDDGTLFTGDSLAWDPHASDLWAEESVCWHSWPDQLASLERLRAHDFVRVVPSHGALPSLPDVASHQDARAAP